MRSYLNANMITMTKIHYFLFNDKDDDAKNYSIFANGFANGNPWTLITPSLVLNVFDTDFVKNIGGKSYPILIL